MQPLYQLPHAPFTGKLHVFLDFSWADTMTEAQITEVCNEYFRVCRDIDVVISTQMPGDRLRGTYMTCQFMPGPIIPWRSDADGWTSRPLITHTDQYAPCLSYVVNKGDTIYQASCAAHETIVHGFAADTFDAHRGYGLARGDGFIRGKDFEPADIARVNNTAPDIHMGKRYGIFVDPKVGTWSNDWHYKNHVDTNWPLPVLQQGLLIFEPGDVPPCITLPMGWTDLVQATDGKLIVDVNKQRVFHPGPNLGSPVPGPYLSFGSGLPPYPIFGANRGGSFCGWVRRHSDTMVIDITNQIVNGPWL